MKMDNFYKYKLSPKFKYRIKKVYENSRFIKYKVKFNYSIFYPSLKNIGFNAYYYLPKDRDKYSAVIILPHLVGASMIESFFSVGLAYEGFAVLEIDEPYYWKKGYLFKKSYINKLTKIGNLKPLIQKIQESVINAEVGVDFLNKRKEVKDIGIMGISIGAWIAGIVSGIEPMITSCAYLLAGGNVYKLINKSSIMKYLKKRIKQLNIDMGKFSKELKFVDPLSYAQNIKNKRIIMINTIFDRIIPKDCTLEFWSAIGKPKIIWLPSGHISSIIFITYVRKKVIDFFKGVF
jgi:cephalosporin-C deacetylase-like acetyl esterase